MKDLSDANVAWLSHQISMFPIQNNMPTWETNQWMWNYLQVHKRKFYKDNNV